MSSLKSTAALEKTKEAVAGIRERLGTVLKRLKRSDENDDGSDDNAKMSSFGTATSEAQATVALSVGMMRYMGARLRGQDEGRKPDDSLRRELNNMKRVLADIKKRRKIAADEETISQPPKSKGDADKNKTSAGTTAKQMPKKVTSQSLKQVEENTFASSHEKKRNLPIKRGDEKECVHKTKKRRES